MNYKQYFIASFGLLILQHHLLMNKAFISLGSNMGNRLQHLQQAHLMIKESVGKIEQSSAVYVTAAWGIEDQPDFYNQVLLVHTPLSAIALMEEILLMEQAMGRIRNKKWAQRVIDMDILFFNDAVIEEDKLHIPHPYLQERRFILQPLVEIAPHLVHPILKKTVLVLLKDCADTLLVTKLQLADEL